MSTPALKFDEFDHEIRPQDDLYRHVNGTWLRETQIPDDKSSWGAFLMLHEASQAAVKAIIEGVDPNAPQGSDDQLIGDLYASYLDTDRIEELGTTPLERPLAAVDAVDSLASLRTLMGQMRRDGAGTLLSMGVDADPNDPERYVFFVGQSGIGLPDEAYYRAPEHAEIREAYVAHIERLLGLAGVADAAEQAARVMQLETDIASHMWDIVARRDLVRTLHPMSIDEFEAHAPILSPRTILNAAGIGDEKLDVLIVEHDTFHADVQALLTEDRLDDWKAWARWRYVSALAPLMTDAMATERFAFAGTTLSGTPEQEPRWKRAGYFAQGIVDQAIGRKYVEKHFPPEAKQRVATLVDHLLQAYGESIRSLDWMTDQTKEQALDKLSKFTPKVGYPDEWRDYSALDARRDDLVGNYHRATAFDLDYDIARARGPIDKGEWGMPPQMVNAYYHPLRNEIVFPAAILQPPFFNMDADDAVNYGGIGSVIGHEIGHGFDDQGSTCDGDGRLRNWWTDADREAFQERTKALVDQYEALVPRDLEGEGVHVNGQLTLGENIGDLGGLTIALKAWQMATGGDVEKIDDLTGTQRLFLSWATVWQQKSRKELARMRLASDPHSPNEFRCNQIVRNLDAFHEAFGVTQKDALWLDPSQRVSIW